MKSTRLQIPRLIWVLLCLPLGSDHGHVLAAGRFSIATYNVENYRLKPAGNRKAKSKSSRQMVQKIIRSLGADVLVLEEIGSETALEALRRGLRRQGLRYPYREWVTARDAFVHLALLSRFPIVQRRSHNRLSFLLYGRRFRVLRGFLEAEIQLNQGYRFTVLAAHLKSKRSVPYADEADLREGEAKVLRKIVNDRLRADPHLNLVVLGDLNDDFNSAAVKAVMGRGRHRLFDTRPFESNGDTVAPLRPHYAPRRIAWTHYYGARDSYGRFDYLLLSPGLKREWDPEGTYVFTAANWGLASDHRPIVAQFFAEDR